MIVLNLISTDARLAARIRDAAGAQALVLHFATPEEALARTRGVVPDAVVYDCGGKLDATPLPSLRALAARRPLVMLSTRQDPLAESAWLKSGATAVVHPDDIEAMLGEVLSMTELSRPERAVQAVLPGLDMTRAHEPDLRAGWEAGLRCLARSWSPRSDKMAQAQLAVDLCMESLRATRAAVLLPEPNGDLRLAAGVNLPEDVRLAYRPGHGAALASSMEANPRLVRVGGGAHDGQRLLPLFGAVLCAPMISDGHFEGVLMVGPPVNGSDYVEAHEDLLLQLARVVARSLAGERVQALSQDTQLFYDWTLAEAPVGLLCLDASHRITAINQEAELLLHVTRSQADGQHVQSVSSALCDLVLRAEAGEPIESPELMQRPGNKGVLEVRLRKGPDSRWVVSVQASKETRLKREDVASPALWEGLASRMAQEIKNPLVAINTFAQLLPRKYESADFRAAFSRVVQEEVDRINRVVETLYQFAREPELQLQQLDVKTTVREVVDTFAKAVAEKGIEFDSQLQETPLSAEIDPDAFKLVLQNLMQNAVDALPAGGRVSVSAASSPHGIEIRVEDSGGGISGDETKKVFEPFYSSKERGTGLGLSLAKKLVEAHYGTLELDSAAPGARFVLRFPTLTGAARGAGGTDDADHTGD
jgi:nitrogen-specific signal transduction histidine kinase